jgi:hypothetical protein
MPPATCPVASPACPFCSPGAADRFEALYGEPPDVAIPGLPGGLRVVLDAFPLGHRGAHLLLTPRTHYPSLARFEARRELAAGVEATLAALRRTAPGHWVFVFEHGTGDLDGRAVKCGGCHVDHAHGHLLVLDEEVEFGTIRDLTEAALLDLGWDLAEQAREADDVFTGLNDFAGMNPYLHVGAVTDRGRVAVTYKQVAGCEGIPSQLLRKLIATAAGRGQPTYWNWKVVLEHRLEGRLQEFKDLVRAFREAFAPLAA